MTEDKHMNPTTPNPNHSAAGGIHRGVWIGGGLMALTIIALATTLVVKNNDALPETTPLAATTTTTPDAATPGQPSAANPPVVVAQQSGATAPAPAPAHEAKRPVHHAPTHNNANSNEPQQVAAAAPVCTTCGVIDGYSAVQVKGENNGVGAVAGGLGGALLGSKIAGRGNHTLGGAIGAVGGGLLGNAIESHERQTTVYDVRVRMADGSVRTVRQATIPNVGQHVNVEGNTLRAIDGQG
jgi:outer membrane lipoprotein SlyB